MRTVVVALILAACVFACSSGASETAAEPLQCDDDWAEIVELLRSGIPTYDYDAADSLQALIDNSDVVVIGTVDSVRRVFVGQDNGATIISSSDIEVLRGATPAGPMTEVPYFSIWNQDGDDPLAKGVDVDGLSFIAFLLESPSSVSGYTPNIQGLHIACGRDSLVTPVIEDLPVVPSGATIDELVALI